MYRGSSKHFKVVKNQQKQFAVWHIDSVITLGWLETGRDGAENECWDYIDEQEGDQGFLFLFPDNP
jgi:uncharacterized protein YbdZ (MbtH family)